MIDTHTHIYAEQFDSDRSEVVARALSAGVSKMLIPNEDADSLTAVAQLCREYSGTCFPLYGLHPTSVGTDYAEQIQRIFAYGEEQGNMVGVGEIGLDLYWDKSTAELQAQAFAQQIQYAIERKLPMSVHIRNAFELFYEVASHFDASQLVGSLHCFAGSGSDAERIVATYPHLMFGFNGTCTYKNSPIEEQLRHVPLSRIVLETDAPYLAPVPHRGKRNEPSFVPLVAQKIAAVTGKSLSEVEASTTQNALSLFSLTDNNIQ